MSGASREPGEGKALPRWVEALSIRVTPSPHPAVRLRLTTALSRKGRGKTRATCPSLHFDKAVVSCHRGQHTGTRRARGHTCRTSTHERDPAGRPNGSPETRECLETVAFMKRSGARPGRLARPLLYFISVGQRLIGLAGSRGEATRAGDRIRPDNRPPGVRRFARSCQTPGGFSFRHTVTPSRPASAVRPQWRPAPPRPPPSPCGARRARRRPRRGPCAWSPGGGRRRPGRARCSTPPARP